MNALRTSAAMSPREGVLDLRFHLGGRGDARRTLVLDPGRHAIGFRARTGRDLHRLTGRLDVGAALSSDPAPPLGAAVGIGLRAFDLFGRQLAGPTFETPATGSRAAGCETRTSIGRHSVVAVLRTDRASLRREGARVPRAPFTVAFIAAGSSRSGASGSLLEGRSEPRGRSRSERRSGRDERGDVPSRLALDGRGRRAAPLRAPPASTSSRS